MLNLSPDRLLDLWHELELAYQGENSFGSNAAEVYVYKLCDYRPMMHNDILTERECGREAATNLYFVLKKFQEKRHCDIKIDGRDFGVWLMDTPIFHRVHVQVISLQKKVA